MISIEKWYILTPLQKLPKNVRDLDKLVVAKGFKKLPNLVTLLTMQFPKYATQWYLGLTDCFM